MMNEGYQYTSVVYTGNYRCPPQMLDTLYPGCCERITLALDIGMTLEETTAHAFGGNLDSTAVQAALPAALPDGLLPSF